MLEELNTRMCHITGTVQGKYNRDLGRGEIKISRDVNGQKVQTFELEVSKRDKKTGEWVNGKNIKVTLFGEAPDLEEGQPIGMSNCYFEPDNYIDKNTNREIRGHGLVAYADKLFVPKEWEKREDQ